MPVGPCRLWGSSVKGWIHWRLPINHDGDTDSTGAITGNLLGASGGTAQIPRRWLEPLELREVITEIAADLFEMKQWRIGEYAGARDNDWVRAKYPPC